MEVRITIINQLV